MVLNLANITKNNCFPKNMPTCFGNMFTPKFCHSFKYLTLHVSVDKTIHFGLFIK